MNPSAGAEKLCSPGAAAQMSPYISSTWMLLSLSTRESVLGQHHAGAYAVGRERILRHHAARDLIYNWAALAGLQPEEQPGLLHSSSRKKASGHVGDVGALIFSSLACTASVRARPSGSMRCSWSGDWSLCGRQVLEEPPL